MNGLTHLDDTGSARMVDVAERAVVVRTATAAARIITTDEVLGIIDSGTAPKGDVAAIARIAGIMGAKRTPDLIPLCHPIALHGVDVDVAITNGVIEITATTRTADRTGVEMEALTAVAVAGLAVIDMIKALDPLAQLTDVRVLSKQGGRHGDWTRPTA